MYTIQSQFEAHTQSSVGGDKNKHKQEKDVQSHVSESSHNNVIDCYFYLSQSKGLSSRLRNALGSIGLGRRAGASYKFVPPADYNEFSTKVSLVF